MTDRIETVTPWRPVGPAELALIEQVDGAAFHLRLPQHPIFDPVPSAEYAANVARFEVRKECLEHHKVDGAGGLAHRRLLDPRREPERLQRRDRPTIMVTQAFR